MTAPGLAILTGPSGVLTTLATVTALALISAVLPLRGGHGQHAHAGPGTLTVRHLTNPPTPRPEPTPEAMKIDWPPGAPMVSPRRLAEQPPSPLEQALTEALAPPSNYIGRHRLAEPLNPDHAEPPLPIELRLTPTPV